MIHLTDCIDSTVFQKRGQLTMKETLADYLLGKISREAAITKLHKLVDVLDGTDANLMLAAKTLKMIRGIDSADIQHFIDNPTKYINMKKKEKK